MTISQNKVVQLTYKLHIDNAQGEFVEQTDNENPLTFIHGIGMMLPVFESNIEGLKVGDAFEFGLTSDDAYGPIDETAVVEIPAETFTGNEDLMKVGNVIPMRDPQGGIIRGTIVDVFEGGVQMDFNHPMAGKNLYFIGEIVTIRDASQEELEHGHVHGDGGVHH